MRKDTDMSKSVLGSLVLDSEQVEAMASGKPRAAKAKSPVIYEVVSDSMPDFAVRRTCGKSSRLLVLMPSQGQYYVKDERSGDIRPADADALSRFFRDVNVSTGKYLPAWADLGLDRSKNAFSGLLDFVAMDGFREVVSIGLLTYMDSVKTGWRYDLKKSSDAVGNIAEMVRSHRTVMIALAKLARGEWAVEWKARNLVDIRAACRVACTVDDAFGTNNALDFLSRVRSFDDLRSLSKVVSVLCLKSDKGALMPNYTAYARSAGVFADPEEQAPSGLFGDYGAFARYLLERSESEGFAGEVGAWAGTWYDALCLELALTGEVYDKYPRNLLTFEKVLSSEYSQIRQQFSREAWERRASELAEQLDWRDEALGVVVTHPSSPDDLANEGARQGNCLASYSNRVLSRECAVAFVRRTSAPDEPWVDVEVREGSVVQAKGAHNASLTVEQSEAVRAWCRARGFDFA